MNYQYVRSEYRNKVLEYLALILLMSALVSAVEIDFDCPNNIFVDEEFECSLSVSDGDGVYDVKVELDQERNSVLQMWNDGIWKSGYYYLQEAVENGDSVDIKLKVSEAGDYDGVLKLRQGDKREFFDIEVDVEENGDVDVEERMEDEVADVVDDRDLDKEIVLNKPVEIISLNGAVVEDEDDKLIYISKDGKISDYLIYGFAIFLIVVIGILVWERF